MEGGGHGPTRDTNFLEGLRSPQEFNQDNWDLNRDLPNKRNEGHPHSRNVRNILFLFTSTSVF
jgi:hypothetical protein